MSSEATYFPDALPDAPALCEDVRCAPEIPREASEEATQNLVQIAEQSDEWLMGRVREEEREALGLLFRRHARAVRNVAYRILRDEAEADDMVQEVFLFVFRKSSLFDPKQGTARSWIFQVAYHRAFDRRRYLNSRHFYLNRELEGTALRVPDPKADLLFQNRSLEHVLGRPLAARLSTVLTPEQQETIQLHLYEGYSMREIAELTGRSLINVRSHYYRGLERLRRSVLPEKSRSK
jgi:RNA polymerase sigma-70 factor (ECF subfamily)